MKRERHSEYLPEEYKTKPKQTVLQSHTPDRGNSPFPAVVASPLHFQVCEACKGNTGILHDATIRQTGPCSGHDKALSTES